MYGIASVVFIIIAAFMYNQASTYSSNPFEINEIQMDKLIKTQSYEVFGTCIDKTVISKNPLQQLKIKANYINTFAVTFKENPWFECPELAQTFEVKSDGENSFELVLEDIPQIKQALRDLQVKSVEKGSFTKIRNDEIFVLVLSIVGVNELKIENLKTSRTVVIGIENQGYLESTLQPLLFLGIFNLIGISMIAFYRKNVFHTRVKLLSTVGLLVYLMWIGFRESLSFENAQSYIKLAMTCFILIICIKNRLNSWQTSIIIGICVINQILLAYSDVNNSKWSTLTWLIYGLNFFNATFIAQGQNIEVVFFSIFGFATQYGLLNQSVDIMHPALLSLILVTLLFGPTLFQLLLLKENFDLQFKKIKQRLHSYELSQQDNLFTH